MRAQIDARVRRAGIRDYMPEQHRRFFEDLPFLVVACADADGQPWASILAGCAGFVSTVDSRTLRVAAVPRPGSPLAGLVCPGAFVGALGIQLATRRRNRVNGTVAQLDGDAFTLAVSQSFGNCAKYIQRRESFTIDGDHGMQAGAAEDSIALEARDRELIAHADTLFVASGNRDVGAGLARGIDVSHRGGRPGFVHVEDARTLTMPDFVGNSYFNTLGNLLHDPKAGLLFIDFSSRDLLHLACDVEIIWDGAEVRSFAGAERLLRFHLRAARRLIGVLPFRWSAPEYASELARTGTWLEATAAP